MNMKNFSLQMQSAKNRKMNKTLFFILAVLLMILNLKSYSQEEPKWDANIGADLVSRYIWRGLASSKTPAIQPYLEVSKGGFALGTWASYTIGEEPIQEIDLYLAYTIGGVTIMLTDYFAYADTLSSYDYFNFGSRSTSHLLDAQIIYEGPESFPIKATLSTLFFGADKNASEENNYSTYIELAYAFNINEYSFSPFIGMNANAGLYNSKVGVVNCGISGKKEIQVNDHFTLPICVSFISNPLDKNTFVVFMISL